MRLVAYRPDAQAPAYIVTTAVPDDPRGVGQIVVPVKSLVGPPLALASLLARGGWEAVPANLDAATRRAVLALAEAKGAGDAG